jgi:RNA polymerase sigma-70 factor (ECF subfamily)
MPSAVAARAEMMDNVRGVLDEALRQLNPQQREIVLLFHQQNWPITEIALFMHMPEGTIKSHLHRARKRMRQAIESDETMNLQAQEAWT